MTVPVTLTGMSLSLPRAGALTDALMAPPGPTVSGGELAGLKERLAGDLAALVDELPPGEKLRLDEFRFGQAREHPDRLAVDEGPFVPSPARCRRAIGAGAVSRCLRRRSGSPATAVAEVLAAGMEDAGDGGDPTARPPWWAGWYRGLAAGGRAMVEAEAVTWATQLWTALAWDRLGQPVVGGGDDWWDCPGTRVLTLKGRADVRVRTEGRPALLVLGSGVPPSGWQAGLGFPALVAAMARGEKAVPGRVVGLWPASGQVRILPVDAGALGQTATAVTSAVATWVDARLEVDAGGG